MTSDHDIAPTYTVVTNIYEGPLDLLLQLIERAELDITKLALAEVTDQYLEYLHNIPESAAADVSSFLVIATKLIQIKSEVLLPRPPAREPGEEDPGYTLAQQLITYKRFKTKADFLMRLERLGLHSYPRFVFPIKADIKIDFSELTIKELVEAAQRSLTQENLGPMLETLTLPPRITIREKINLINNFLGRTRRGTFQLLVRNAFRLEIVVTFLALLELIKRQMVNAHQDSIFGEIEIEPTASWRDDTSFELEFEE